MVPKTGNGENDQMLWASLRQSDHYAFTSIFEKYHGTLYNYGCKLTKNTSVVEDAVQEVFIDIWRLRANLSSDITSIKFYLYRALRRRIHTALNRYPDSDELSEVSEDDIFQFSFADTETTLIESEARESRSMRIKQLLEELPERQVEAITLRYFDEFSFPEIAQIMGVNEKSVRNFIYKALVSMRDFGHMLSSFLLIFTTLY